jgi:hypothetical protein
MNKKPMQTEEKPVVAEGEDVGPWSEQEAAQDGVSKDAAAEEQDEAADEDEEEEEEDEEDEDEDEEDEDKESAAPDELEIWETSALELEEDDEEIDPTRPPPVPGRPWER